MRAVTCGWNKWDQIVQIMNSATKIFLFIPSLYPPLSGGGTLSFHRREYKVGASQIPRSINFGCLLWPFYSGCVCVVVVTCCVCSSPWCQWPAALGFGPGGESPWGSLCLWSYAAATVSAHGVFCQGTDTLLGRRPEDHTNIDCHLIISTLKLMIGWCCRVTIHQHKLFLPPYLITFSSQMIK